MKLSNSLVSASLMPDHSTATKSTARSSKSGRSYASVGHRLKFSYSVCRHIPQLNVIALDSTLMICLTASCTIGQSESGKSTMIKNFQLYFCPTSFYAEAEAWRVVIHLNLVRHVNHILEVISTSNSPQGKTLPDKDFRVLQMRLSPLKQVELILTRALSAETGGSASSSPTSEKPTWRPDRATEVSIRGGSGWKSFMRKRRGSVVRSPAIPDEVEDARRILDACKDDIVALWKAQEPGDFDDGSIDHGR